MKELYLAQWDYESTHHDIITECRIVEAGSETEAYEKASAYFKEYAKNFDWQCIDSNVYPVIK